MTIEAKVSQAFSTSMEVFAEVFIEDTNNRTLEKVNQGIYTFVHINIDGTPIALPKLLAETKQEKKRLENVYLCCELSLILVGKMDVREA